MIKKEMLTLNTQKVRFFDFKIGPPEKTKISQTIYRWARFELQVRKDCSEKLGAVGALYRLGEEGLVKMSTSKHATNIICRNEKRRTYLNRQKMIFW